MLAPDGFVRLARTIGIVAVFVAAATDGADASSAAGLVISNTVTAIYDGAGGAVYGTQSNTVTVTVSKVGAIAVSPKETAVDPASEGYPVGTQITRTFTITNAGNYADAYTVGQVQSGAGTIASVAFLTPSGSTPVIVGTTTSPTLGPGESVKVVVGVVTTGVAVGTAFPVTLAARSTNTQTSNGLVSDGGRAFAVAQPQASIGGVEGPNTLVTKLVDNVRTHSGQPGETVTYSIAFKNYGGSPATNTVLVDAVPAGLTPLPKTVALNGTNVASAATLSGQTLSVKIGTMPIGASDVVTFDAVVAAGNIAGATFVNVATLQADGVSQVATTPASVLIGLANICYDGYAGGGSPVAGATLTLRDWNTKQIVALPKTGTGSSSLYRAPQDLLIGVPATGLPPNLNNANPYATGSDGAYSFAFTQAELGTAASPAVYELDISAPNYKDRRIQVTVAPDASGMLYSATLKNVDDQQLAVPGGFALTANAVSLSEVFGLLGNLPMFAPHPVTVSKTVDRDVASGGDRLVYTVAVAASGSSFGTTKVVDTLPAGVAYAPGTARIDNVPAEPVRAGRVLTWTLADLTQSHAITYAAVVLPNAAEGSTLVNVVSVDALSVSGTHAAASASADTRVVAGALGNRIVLTGRVFVDRRGSGRFREGDTGVGGVRIYLEDGESVTTDRYGRYTFPSVHPGQHVLRVDDTTLPATVRPFADRAYDSPKSLQRLVHGLFDSGLMQDVNFAVEPAS
ncbi:MAG TPA: hypothetical protein VGN14_14890 [Candidatus Elarobacter sp.]